MSLATCSSAFKFCPSLPIRILELSTEATDNFERVFSEGQLPEEIQEVENKGTILQTTVVAGIASSLTEAKRLIDQGAIKINGETVTRWDQEVKRGDIIKGGPHKFRRVK